MTTAFKQIRQGAVVAGQITLGCILRPHAIPLVLFGLYAAVYNAVFGAAWRRSHWDWQPWFAWHPVMDGWRPYWFCRVYRRPVVSAGLISTIGWRYTRQQTSPTNGNQGLCFTLDEMPMPPRLHFTVPDGALLATPRAN